MEFNSASILAVGTGFQALFLIGFEAADPLHKTFCLEVESTGAQETFQIPEGTGELREWLGEREEKPSVVWAETIKNKDWEGSLYVPVNAYKDDKLGVYRGQAQALGHAAATHPTYLLGQALIQGFTKVAYDGVAFFSASHPRGGTLAVQSNVVSGALSATTFRTALSQLQSMTDYYGKPLRSRSMGMKVYLIVGPSNRATAKSIVALATTASGAGNPDYEEAEVIVDEDLIGDYANYWFVSYGGGPVYPLILQIREKPDLLIISNPEHPDIIYKKRVPHLVSGRWNVGYGFYQLIVGSTGA